MRSAVSTAALLGERGKGRGRTGRASETSTVLFLELGAEFMGVLSL